MASQSLIPFFVAMMLLTGCANTILTKLQDRHCIRNCNDPNPRNRVGFEQPVLQTAQMFIGEMGCWLVVGGSYLYRRLASRLPSDNGYEAINTTDGDTDTNVDDADEEAAAGVATGPARKHSNANQIDCLRGYGIFLLALPAICDICGTTLMNAGLLLVAASVYQMTRGALVLFVGLFSVIFLRRKLRLFQWLSLVGVVTGVAIVGLAGAIYPDSQKKAPEAHGANADDASDSALLAIVGVLLIAGAQIFTATQFVLEEWIMENSSIEAITVVGWEGIFGFTVTLLGMAVLHLAIGRTDAGRYGYFDMVEGWRQLTSARELIWSSIFIMISIGAFNFFGLSVTRNVSATSRSTIDTCRTLFIWIVSLGLGWETFKWLQVLGFALLVYFTFLFNGIIQPPIKYLVIEEVEELLPEEPIEHM